MTSELEQAIKQLIEAAGMAEAELATLRARLSDPYRRNAEACVTKLRAALAAVRLAQTTGLNMGAKVDPLDVARTSGRAFRKSGDRTARRSLNPYGDEAARAAWFAGYDEADEEIEHEIEGRQAAIDEERRYGRD